MKAHADASPSSSGTWIACPASVTLARGKVRKPTVYTREGTAAHTLCELLLDAKEVLIPKVIHADGEDVLVTPEMLETAQIYADYVSSVPDVTSWFIEKRVQLNVEGEPLYGTADAVLFQRDLKRVEIVDFKYGQGVAVDPSSSQLKIYALASIEDLIGPFEDIEVVGLTVVQPRSDPDNPIKSIEIPLCDILDWEIGTLRPAIARLAAGDTTETPGSHCRWCVRAGECKSLAAQSMALAKVEFDEIPPDPSGMTNEELAAVLEHGEMISDWLAKVRTEVTGRIDVGQKVPGWKLVPKRAMRKWDGTDDAILIGELFDLGLPVAEITRVRTIGDVERAMKRHKVPLKALEQFTVKESSGSTLAREADRRLAIDTDPKNMFSEIVDFVAST